MKNKLDGGTSSWDIGVSLSRWMTLKLGTSKLVDKGVTEGIGEISAIDFSALVRLGVTVVVTGDEEREALSSFMKASREANNS